VVAYNDVGSYGRMHGHGVIAAWRPILWFLKPPRRRFEHLALDMVCRDAKPEKDFDSWAQPLPEAIYYIDKLSAPGDLVVEPFLGSGTTVVAARALGRRIIAAEIDPKAVAAAAARLAANDRAEVDLGAEAAKKKINGKEQRSDAY
jgi:hypothetical protein